MNLLTASFILTDALIGLPLTVQAEKVDINAVGDARLSDPLKTRRQGRDGCSVLSF
jgi:hypothetical protein